MSISINDLYCIEKYCRNLSEKDQINFIYHFGFNEFMKLNIKKSKRIEEICSIIIEQNMNNFINLSDEDKLIVIRNSYCFEDFLYKTIQSESFWRKFLEQTGVCNLQYIGQKLSDNFIIEMLDKYENYNCLNRKQKTKKVLNYVFSKINNKNFANIVSEGFFTKGLTKEEKFKILEKIPEAITNLDNVTQEMYNFAFSKDIEIIDEIPYNFKTKEMAIKIINDNPQLIHCFEIKQIK